VLEGRLGDFTLPDILRLLAFTAKSGRLWVEHGGTRGRIEVLEGRVRDATVDAGRLGLARRLLGLDLVAPETVERAVADLDRLPSDLDLARRLIEVEAVAPEQLADLVREQVLDAVFELLRWEDGAFAFEAAAPASRGPSSLDLALGVDELLDEASRRLDAHDAVRERTGAGGAVVSIRRPGRERAEVALTPEGWTLLALVDGRRTVDDIVMLSGQGDYRTRRTLAGLLDEGVVAIGDAESAAPGDRLLAASRRIGALEARLAPVARPADAAPPTPVAPVDAVEATFRPADPTPSSPEAADPHGHRPAPAGEADPSHEHSTAAASQAAPAGPGPAAPAGDPQPWRAPDRDREQLEIDELEISSDDDQRRVTPLRAKVRTDRLGTDPEIDEDLVKRLIDGVEGL
jgi:hypothetical protein